MTAEPPPHFDLQRFVSGGVHGHGGRLGIRYVAHGPDWAEIACPMIRN